jgi:hypothetical protein
MKRLAVIFMGAAGLLAACASTPSYTPAASDRAAGYSETRVEDNRYFVTYRAPSGADIALIQDYALLRAADVTLEHGAEWFWVDRRNLDGQASSYSGPSIGVGVGGGSWGSHSGGSVGVGMNFPIGGRTTTRASAATLEIRFGQGPKPDAANAYDARATSENLRARLIRG